MNTYRYDGTFSGFLSAVFEAYVRRDEAPQFEKGTGTATMFGETVEVEVRPQRMARLRRGIVRSGGQEVWQRVRGAFLSETPGIDGVLFAYLRLLFAHGVMAADNPLGTPGPVVWQAARATSREVHRMHAFVRFSEGADGSWRSVVEPVCNVLPLIGPHFAERYAALRWIIVDARRGYALLHDTGAVHFVGAPQTALPVAEDEEAWQQLWKTYYHAVDIPERRNLALRARHMPRRYWKHLTEIDERQR